MKILCGGPISEDKDVYKAHIESLLSQSYAMDYKGIDNSPEPLNQPVGFGVVQWRRVHSLGEYKQNRARWSKRRLRKMGEWREDMRMAALAGGYDYLFMVDSDLILGRDTLRLLLEAGKDFIAGLFWTQWRPWRKVRWVNVFDINGNDWTNISEDLKRKFNDGGVHQVPVTGACSLISKRILDKISYDAGDGRVGEDLCMAIRARDAGIPLYVHAGVTIEHRRRR